MEAIKNLEKSLARLGEYVIITQSMQAENDLKDLLFDRLWAYSSGDTTKDLEMLKKNVDEMTENLWMDEKFPIALMLGMDVKTN